MRILRERSINFQRHMKVFMFLLCIFLFPAISRGTGKDSLPLLNTISFPLDTINGLVANEREIRAGLLYDVERGKIVWEKDMDYAYPIASLTKMMVCLLAIEDINAGNVCLDDQITVTRIYKKKIRRRRYTTYTVEEKYILEDLLKMALVASHNESTVWIAKHCSGDLQTFVEKMNRRCLELGMTKTQYSNPSGLPAIIRELDNSSSPRDQLILSLELLKHPKLVEIAAIPYATVYNGKGNASYRNHNGLVITYGMEIDGLKTGYTKAAGFCLAATANRGNHRLVSIVFGCRSPWVRNGIVANMMNTYYDAIKLGRLGEGQVDIEPSRAFLDSVYQGLVSIEPNIEQKIPDNSSDESYAYTYKTVTQKVKKSHTVRSGENLGKIADRYYVSVSDVKKWNKLRGSTIRSGQKLAIFSTVKKRIPVKLIVDPDESIADMQPSQDTSDDCETEINSIHLSQTDAKVKADTMHKSDHEIKNTVPKEKIAEPSSKYIYYTVQPGDTLWNIAQRYQSDINKIKKLNNLNSSKSLRSGTRIKVPVQGS